MKLLTSPLIVVGNQHVYHAFNAFVGQEQIHFLDNNQAALDALPELQAQFKGLTLAIVDAESNNLPTSHLISEIRKNPQLRSMVIFVLGKDLSKNEFQEIQEQNIAGLIKKPEIPEGYADIADVLMKFWEICILA